MKNILKKAVAKKVEKKTQEKPAERGYVEPRPCGCAPRTCSSILYALACAIILCGCVYKGGKVVDGTNLAIVMRIPGTDWQINALDYVGGVRVAGQDSTHIVVTNDVEEDSSYFCVIKIKRHSKMSADIEPLAGTAVEEAEEPAK